MPQIEMLLDALQQLVEELDKATSVSESYKVYAAIKAIVDDLQTQAELDQESVVIGNFKQYKMELLHGCRAIAGLSPEIQQSSWARGAIGKFKSPLCFNIGS